MAGSSATLVTHEQPEPSVGRLVYDFVADDTDGSWPAIALPSDFDGRILDIISNPGATAPTDNYDVALLDGDGFDLLGGAGADRDTAVTERAAVTDGYVSRREPKTLTPTGNAVNNATTRITLHYTQRV